MNRAARRMLFYLLIGVFCAVSPLIIAYALGYSFNIRAGVFEQRGGIFVKSRTPGLAIGLDGITVKETSLLSGNAFITDVPPGIHRITITKKGHYPWEKRMRIEPGIVTELRGIVLVLRPLIAAAATAEERERIVHQEKPENFLTDLQLNSRHELFRANGTTTEVLALNVHSFDIIDQDTLLFVDTNGFLARFALASGALEILGRPGFYLEKKLVHFIHSSEDTVALIDSRGGLYLARIRNTPHLEAITGEVKDALFDSKSDKLLLIRSQELEIMWLQDNAYQPFQMKAVRERFITSPQKIIDAAWFYGTDAHVVFLTSEGVFFTDLDRRGGQYLVKITDETFDKIFTFPENPQTIFLQKDKKSWAIKF